MKKVLFIFGTAKLAYKIMECVEERTVVVVFSTKHFSETKVYDCNYVDTDGSYDTKKHKIISDTDFCDGSLDFVEDGINIYEMNVYTHSILFEVQENFLAISCCRSGLTDTYIPLLNSMDCRGVIVSLDNDKSISRDASKLSKNCDVYAGVAHCHVPNPVKWNEDGTTATIIADRFGYLVFPPKCNCFRKYFIPALSSPVAMTYTDTEEDFQRAVYEKLIDVNVPHSLSCLEVKILFPNEYEAMTFADIEKETFDAIKDRVLIMHKQMYTYYFSEDDQLEVAVNTATRFLDRLKEYTEPCIRGVDFNSPSSLLKLNMHMQIVRDAGIDITKYASIIDSG